MERVKKQAEQYLTKQRKINRWQKIVNVMAGVVVFCTTYALILPAITMTTPLVCGLEEHTHTEACYTLETVTAERRLICGEPEVEPHTHDENCYTQETIYACGLEEAEPHTHGESCYSLIRGELTCTAEFDTVETEVTEEVIHQVEYTTTDGEGNPVTAVETVAEPVTRTVIEQVPHVHTDDCYTWTEELTCLLPETEGHTHSEDCGAETVNLLTCEKAETEGHVHTDECWFIPENEGETQEIRTLICEKEEHTHDDNCYLALELEEKVKYYCGFDTEHIHTEECYFEDGTLKCNIPEHTHSEACLEKPLPAPVPVELSESFTAESEDGAVILTLHVDGTVLLPQMELDGEEGDGKTYENCFRLIVTQSEDMEVYDEYAEMAAEEGEVMMVGVLDYTLTYDGEEVDLDACEVTVEVTPTEAFQEMLDTPEALGLMTLDLTDELDGQEEEPEMELFFKAYTDRQGTVAYSVTQGANPSFTVEYYAYLERVTTAEGTEGIELPVINTEGGILPQNGSDPTITNLYLNSDKKVTTVRTLTQIYKKETFEYVQAPGLRYINIILTNQQSNYELSEILTRQSDEEEWTCHEYDPKTTRITNRPQTAETDPENFILIIDGTQLRMVYEPKREQEKINVNFYDYDITDGKIYDTEANASSRTNPKEVTTQTDAKIWANVNQQGINSNGAVLAFGNSNVPTSLGNKTWENNGSNTPNKSNSNGYQGCTFGMVQDTLDGEALQYNIASPALFNEGTANGKTIVTDRKLNFSRVGDTYTLSSVVQVSGDTETTIVDDLESISSRDNWNKTKKIFGNDFWPLDSLAGTQGRDLRFGNAALEKMRCFVGADNSTGAYKEGTFPTTDFGGDHNAYFGMQFGVEFSLTNSYVGPLEYYFFGDDDMWVYMVDTENNTSKLICDLGGIHAAVGEYVNLWDYIDKSVFYEADGTEKKVPKLDENGAPMYDKNGQPLLEDYIKKYELRFYYTERGASGSTCWMQFTLPTVVGLDLEELLEQQVSEDTGSLWIQKELSGIENTQSFEFKLELSGDAPDNYMVMGANGELLEGDNALAYIANGDTFKLQAGDILVIKGLPEGTTYRIEEINSAGYHTEITTSVAGSELKVEEGVITSGTIQVNDTTKVVYTNTATYELPATGGAGTTLWYTMGALSLLGAAYLMYKKRQWIMREGDGMCQ